ncbi:MAG: GntR family transcriptional regulator [Actinobacteria bacterium]|nr:GntR family transcriptional regulator [Actinomycetota bacterium]
MARAGSARLLAPPDGDVASLADRAFYSIRELIVSLELSPGSVINERELTERLAIGRTPTREALRRLAQEKLIEVYPRRGMFVTKVDVRDLARLSEVRVALEPEAARLAAERGSEDDLLGIRDLLGELVVPSARDERGLIDLDERIHRTIYRCAHNDFLEATLEEYYALALRIWLMALHQTGELRAAVYEHRDLLEAIAAGEGRAAAQIMRDHVLHFETAMRAVLLET